MKKLLKDKKGVFGLTSVQAFFAIILGLALLSYVIIIIMGSLQGTTILSQDSLSKVNESNGYFLNTTTNTLLQSAQPGFSLISVTQVVNTSDGVIVTDANYTVTGGTIVGTGKQNWTDVKISYTYRADSSYQKSLTGITGNTSLGITNFFGNISPVYAILAILVIILVLIVLVRIVQAPSGTNATPQL